jgi:flagellar protein FlaI
MNTGHTTYSTMHAGTVQAAVNRLLNEPINIPIMMMQALNVVLIQGLMIEDGKKTRRSKSIVEITSVDQRTGNLSINEVFRWSADKGKYEHKAESYVFQVIMNNRGWSEKQLNDEIENRKKIIRYLVKHDIHKYEDVAPIIESFYRNPSWVMDQLKKGEL